MEIVTSWMEEGIEKGREEGRKQATLQLVLRLLIRRLGDVPEATENRVRLLSQTDLEALGESLLDFQTSRDLEGWLSDHQSA